MCVWVTYPRSHGDSVVESWQRPHKSCCCPHLTHSSPFAESRLQGTVPDLSFWWQQLHLSPLNTPG